MKPVEILEWTMGWPWPVFLVLAALLVWGVSRLMSWDDKRGVEDQTPAPAPGPGCVCTCE